MGGIAGSAEQRFRIHRAAWARPLLALFGATKSRAFVAVGEQVVRIRFGSFDEQFERAEIMSAAAAPWSLLRGVGWRLGNNAVALIGSTSGVVRLTLRSPRTVRVMPFISVRVDRLFVSVDSPGELLALLSAPR